MRSDKFGSQLERKSKTRFFTFLYVYVSWIEQDKIKILISQLTPAKFRYFADQNGQRRTQWKWILAIFKYKNKYQTVRAQKVDETNGVIWLISFFLSWVMALKLPKIVHFSIFVLTSARNLNILKQFISIHLKDLIMFFEKIVFFIGVQDFNSSRDIKE